MKLFLVGYMGSGKTTLGKHLANKLNYDFLDMDLFFENRFRITIYDFFQKYGQEQFRNIESRLLKETEFYDNTVFATGGGTACFFDNMDWMNSQGITIYVKMPAEALAYRLNKSRLKRPLIANLADEELKEYIQTQLNQREAFYNLATLTVDGFNAKTDDILQIIKEKTPIN